MIEHVVLFSTGKPETGLWCPDCRLPSRVRLPVFMTSEGGSSSGPDIDACTECGRDFWMAPP